MPTINKNTCKEKSIHIPSESAPYYNSQYWKRLRNSYIRLHPICQMCALENRSTPAEQVHHRIPFMTGKTEEERWNLLLNPDNLMSLCIRHHKEIHNNK